MIVMTVDVEFDVSTLVQFTCVPFKVSITGVVSSLDTSDKLLSVDSEIIEKVNVIEFTSNVEVGELRPRNRTYLLAVVCPSGTRKKFHSRKPPVMVHVNSS